MTCTMANFESLDTFKSTTPASSPCRTALDSRFSKVRISLSPSEEIMIFSDSGVKLTCTPSCCPVSEKSTANCASSSTKLMSTRFIGEYPIRVYSNKSFTSPPRRSDLSYAISV